MAHLRSMSNLLTDKTSPVFCSTVLWNMLAQCGHFVNNGAADGLLDGRLLDLLKEDDLTLTDLLLFIEKT